MIDGLQVVKFSLRDFWEDFVLLAAFNLLWSATAFLPLVPLVFLPNVSAIWRLVASILLVVPLPIVSGALCFVTNQISHGKAVNWRMFSTGVRQYWGKSLVVALANVVVLILLVTNVQFYAFIVQGTWTNIVLSLWVVAALYWLLVQVLWFPMILELESEKVLLALRNALVMAIITPAFSITLAVAILILSVLSVVLTVPLVLFWASLVLLIMNHATRSRLAYALKKPYQPGMEEG